MNNHSFFRLLCLLFLFITPVTPCNAQSIEFQYDAAGNRILRQIVMDNTLKSSEVKSDILQTIKEDFREGELEILPNPTKGIVEIRHNEQGEFKPVSVKVMAINGAIVFNGKMDSPVLQINLTDKPEGSYVMIITNDDKTLQYQIVKRN